MSKVRNLLLVVLLVLCVMPMFAACNKDDSPVINIDDRIYVSNIVLDPESKSIPLVKDATYKLKYSFLPAEATNKTVEFSSSNPNVATVDKYGKVTAVGSGSCNITGKTLDNKNALSDMAVVTVVNEKEKLAKPTNPRFDGTRLSWSAITVKSSTTFVPTYELSISRDGGAVETYMTTATYYTDLPFGAYSVSLRTLGDEENILYDNSDSTDIYSFTKLGAPTELNVTAIGDTSTDDARSYVLSFALAKNSNSLDDYDYRITPVSGNATISTAQQDIWDNAIRNGMVETIDGKKVAKINIPATIANDPVYIVFGTKTDAARNVYGSGFENVDRVQIGKLVAPSNLLISAVNDGSGVKNKLTWNNVSSADKYKLKVEYKNSANEIIKTIIEVFDAWGVNSYDLSSLQGVPASYDSYDVYLYALGTSDTALVLMDSESSVCARKQLSSVQGEINITNNTQSTYVITWNPVTNAQGYKIYISDNDLDYLTAKDLTSSYNTTEPQFEFGFDTINSSGNPIWNIGDNYIKIVAIAESGSAYEDSPVRKAQQKLVKLATPELKVSKGVLTWNPVSGAETYTIDFCNGHTYTASQVDGTQSYSYEPTREDFNYKSDCDVTITVTNTSSVYYIKSQASAKMRLNRFNKIAQSSLAIVEGNLTWGTDSGLVDESGNVINTSSVEIKILKTSDSTVLKTIASSSRSLSIANALKDLDGDGFYSFSLRAVSTISSGATDINGDWSEVIKTYQMEAPKNLRVSDGVLTWDKMVDAENVGVANAGIRYVIKLNNAELTNVNLTIDDTSTVLQNLTSNTNYSVSIQTKIVSDVGGSIKVIGREDTYLINSLFSDEINVKLTPKPINLEVRGYTLYWTSSGSNVSSYKVSLYKSGETVPLAVEENVSPSDRFNPSFDFSTSEFSNKLVLAGNYEFVVQAWGDSTSYLTSYVSDSLTICKLATPQITVSDQGKISWTSSIATLDNMQEVIDEFYLTVRNKRGNVFQTKLTTTSTALSFLTDETIWCGKDNELTITLQAKSGDRSRIYDSDTTTYQLNGIPQGQVSGGDPKGSVVTLYKLPKISTDLISINEDTQMIEWSAGDYAQSNGYFNIIIYQKTDTDQEQILVNTTVQAGQDGKGTYRISPNWAGTNYYVRIQQVGFSSKTVLSTSETVTEDKTEGAQQVADSQNIVRRLTSEYSDAKYFTRLAEATGIYLSNEDGAPVLNWQSLSENTHLRYRITLQKFDEDNAVSKANQLIYYVAYDASKHGKYSLNLFDSKGYNYEKIETNIMELDGGNYFGEYQMYITVVPNAINDVPETTITIGGQEYLLMSSRTSKKQTMTIYTAPSINIEGSSVKVINPNSSSRGVTLKFQEVVLSGENYVASGEAKTVSLGSNEDYYEVTKTQLTPNKLYQVTTQAIGNGANLVSSPEKISDIIVTKIDALEPNTVAATLSAGEATNVANFDGWYVKAGKVNWNEITGATGYKIYMTSGSTSKMVLEREADSAMYSEALADMSFASNFGVFTLQFQVKGGKVIQTENKIDGQEASIGYLSSDLSNGTYVNKLYTPNGTYNNSRIVYQVRRPSGNVSHETEIYRTGAYARIDENGEFDFGIRDGSGKWLDKSGATKYMLSIQGVGTTSEYLPAITYDLETEGESHFMASEVFGEETGSYMVSMYAIGNDWYGSTSDEPIYLNSDAQDSFKLLYSGVIGDLGVTEGNVTWQTDNTSSINNYDLRYKVNGAADFNSVALTTNTFSFDGKAYEGLKGQLIDEIYVRFKGIPTTDGNAIEGYVNTAWNKTPLTKLMKLPNIGKTTKGLGDDTEEVDLYIDESGQLAWAVGDELKTLQTDNNTTFDFNISREVKVGEEVVQPRDSDITQLNRECYIVPRVAETSGESGENKTYIYDISAYVRGTGTKDNPIYASETRANDSSAPILFINGSEYTFRAGKLNNPADGTFLLDKDNGSVRISWDLAGCSIKVITNNAEEELLADEIMLTYYLDNDMTNPVTKLISAEEYKFTDDLDPNSQKGGTAFWQLATFRDLKMSVLNSKGKAFGSEAIALDVATVEFRYFESGTGTRNDPFVITNVDQLSYMYWLPEKYFRLGNDIILPNLVDLQDTYPTARTNIKYPAQFYDSNSTASTKYTLMQFRGGFDGAGYAIKNYQVIKSTSSSIWYSLSGTDLDTLILEDGSEFDDTVYRNTSGIITNLTVEVNTLDVSLLRSTYNGILVANNAGLIYNCHIRGDDAKLNTSGNRLDVVEGKFTISNTTPTEDDKYYIGGIAGITTDQKELTKILNLGSENPIYLYKQGYIGRIENCTNMLDLKVYNQNGNYEVAVGGIVGYLSNGYIVGCTNGSSSVVSGANSGAISGYYAGGIAGSSVGAAFDKESDESTDGYTKQQYYSYIYGCRNFATINTQVLVGENESPESASEAGGIVGLMGYSYVTFCINYGTITTDGAAAIMGGICGAAGVGAYIANTMNAGMIRYNEYYNSQQLCYAIGGALCGAVGDGGNLILYNSATNSGCIVRNNADGTQTISSNYFTELGGVIFGNLYTSQNGGLDKETLENLQSQAYINDPSITVDGSVITTCYPNIDGLYPRFAFDETAKEWTIEWTTQHVDSSD